MWLDDILKENYSFVKAIRQSDAGEIIVLKNKELDKKIVKRVYNNSKDVNVEVYKILQKISCPNIPIVYEVVEHDDKVTILEEYIDGVNVSNLIAEECYEKSGSVRIVMEICKACMVLHSKGIVHRDIKPDNIMVTTNGDVKLVDYSISRLYKPGQSEDTNILGTVNYAAPEQFGVVQTDMRADIYSIGILLNVLLTGQMPSRKIATGKEGRIITKCTMINPDQRYQSIDKLIKALGGIK